MKHCDSAKLSITNLNFTLKPLEVNRYQFVSLHKITIYQIPNNNINTSFQVTNHTIYYILGIWVCECWWQREARR